MRTYIVTITYHKSEIAKSHFATVPVVAKNMEDAEFEAIKRLQDKVGNFFTEEIISFIYEK